MKAPTFATESKKHEEVAIYPRYQYQLEPPEPAD